jgi:hypothetical protein
MHGKQLFNVISSAASDADPGVLGVYASFERSDLKYQTGSHADVKGNNFIVALAKQTNEKMTLGLFGQKLFGGSYTTSHEALLSGGGTQTVNSAGDLDGQGFGIFAEYRPDGQKEGNIGRYYQAVIKAGNIKNDFRANNYGSKSSSFSSDKNVSGMSLGVGHVVKAGQNRTAEYYGHIIYTSVGSDSVTDSIEQQISFEKSSSTRLLAGAKLNFSFDNKKPKAYVGAALDYEFDGQSCAYVGGTKADAADLKGISGIIELGLNNGNKTDIFDFGLQGYMGKKRGFGATLTLGKRF